MTIQPFYVSKDCLGEGSVKVFLASDLEKLIQERIAVLSQELLIEDVPNSISLKCRKRELESMLAVLNPSNEKENK